MINEKAGRESPASSVNIYLLPRQWRPSEELPMPELPLFRPPEDD